MLLVVTSAVFRSDNSNPLIIQPMIPPVALVLQSKVAVDPSVAITEVGVLTKAETETYSTTKSYEYLHDGVHHAYLQVICKVSLR